MSSLSVGALQSQTEARLARLAGDLFPLLASSPQTTVVQAPLERHSSVHSRPQTGPHTKLTLARRCKQSLLILADHTHTHTQTDAHSFVLTARRLHFRFVVAATN